MKERPILFSGDMVRAILDGRKTQTRRVIKPQPWQERGMWFWWNKVSGDRAGNTTPDLLKGFLRNKCPYGQPGDRLWVRETWSPFGKNAAWYRADFTGHLDSPGSKGGAQHFTGWKPSIHMPRWASRITLEIVSVHVERLQEITNADAKSEGVYGTDWGGGMDAAGDANYVPVFRQLWDSLNAKPGYGWDANPWVWVITFKRVLCGNVTKSDSGSFSPKQ